MRVDRVSCTSPVKGEVKLQSLAVGWRGWRLRTMRWQSFFIHRLIQRFPLGLEALSHVIQFSQSNVRAMCVSKALTPYAYDSIPKIASVIQPGRRWDSPTKLTSPIFLHTFSENNGIFQVEGSSGGGLPRYSGLFITCRRRWTWPHGKTAFWEADWKEGALKIMDDCALCNLLTVTLAAYKKTELQTRQSAWLGLL